MLCCGILALLAGGAVIVWRWIRSWPFKAIMIVAAPGAAVLLLGASVLADRAGGPHPSGLAAVLAQHICGR